ncbi:hypothetical protein [Christensenella tenuis]|uniref:Prealbumin-like fold domain-containing protein n=1 Tax=Christensenella tenuis TaxID=2763033 RepID=A0ABR7EEZ3_9FIRM|nr:hypothetical protein [Christensenella tenuis]MBC5648333.1 hypothetical protein [Christensenella tenuis]
MEKNKIFPEGNTAEAWTVGKEDRQFIGRIGMDGTYRVRELSAPGGYNAAAPVFFTIHLDDRLKPILVINNRRRGAEAEITDKTEKTACG